MSAEALTRNTNHGIDPAFELHRQVRRLKRPGVEGAARFAAALETAVEDVLDEAVRKPARYLAEAIETLKVKGMEHELNSIILKTYSPFRVWYMKRKGWTVRARYRQPMIQLKGKVLYRRSWVLVPAVSR